MKDRTTATKGAIGKLLKDGFEISPFLELGAERCQRALALENELDAQGLAVDISFDMLRFAAVVARHLGYKKMPIRICCDVYNLPIRDDALPFVFCYQTLHHFPDPGPICKEVARVLRDRGVLYFDEEPVKGTITRLARLYHRRGHRLSALEKLLGKLHLLSVISKGDELELAHGILEEEFDLKTWQKALAPFQDVRMTINWKLGLRLNGFCSGVSKTVAQVVGGNIEAICHIDKRHQASTSTNSLLEILRCPNCMGNRLLYILQETQSLYCPECGQLYPEVDGVVFLFENSLGRELYPDIYSRWCL